MNSQELSVFEGKSLEGKVQNEQRTDPRGNR